MKKQNSGLTLSFGADLGAAFLRAGEQELRIPTILLAEDDDVVRDMRQAVGERDGFEVIAVANVTRSAPPYRNPSNAVRDLIAHAIEYDLSERVESREAVLPPHADL